MNRIIACQFSKVIGCNKSCQTYNCQLIDVVPKNINPPVPNHFVPKKTSINFLERSNVTTIITRVLGGETAIWTEQTSDSDIIYKVFPRTWAYAERLWSNPSKGDCEILFKKFE